MKPRTPRMGGRKCRHNGSRAPKICRSFSFRSFLALAAALRSEKSIHGTAMAAGDSMPCHADRTEPATDLFCVRKGHDAPSRVKCEQQIGALVPVSFFFFLSV